MKKLNEFIQEDHLKGINIRFHESLNYLMEGVQIINHEWRYLYVNDSIEEQGIYKRSELIGRTMMEKFPGIEETEFFNILLKSTKEQIQQKIDIKFTFPDHSTGWYEMCVQPIPEGLLILSLDKTAHILMEQKLNSNVEFNHKVLASLSAQILVIEEDGMVLTVNKPLDDFLIEFGFLNKNDTSLGRNYFKLLHAVLSSNPLLADSFENGVHMVFKNQLSVFEIECPVHINEATRWFSLCVVPLEIDSDKVVISHQDITSRKVISENLKISEIKYRRLFESAQDGILILDAETGKIVDVNPFLQHLLGYTFNHFIGKELWEIGLFKDATASKESFLELQNKLYIRYEDLPLQTKEGNKINVEFVSNVYFVNDEKVIQCNIRDISNRILIEESLSKFQSNLKAVIENTDADIYSLDKNLNYTTSNKNHQNTIKNEFDLEVNYGDNVFEFLTKSEPDLIQFWIDTYSKALNGEIVKFEKHIKKGSKDQYTSYSIFPIWENNKTVGVSCFVLDITNKKEQEINKNKVTNDLMQRNKDLEQFTFIVSHNLRAPVANIIGLTSLLKDEYSLNEDKLKIINGLDLSITRLDEVIGDLNNILQLRVQIDEPKKYIDLKNLILDIQVSISNTIANIEVDIQTNFNSCTEIKSIKSYLYSIFYNLISNSIKYRKQEKKLIIQISSSISKNHIELIYQDNGIGIDLFKNGNQVFGLYKRFHLNQAEGKGVGLYMVKTQVEALGGSISIESEINKGTEFKIQFPLPV